MTRSADNQTLPEAISSPLDGHTMTPAVAEPTSVNVLASAITIDNRLRPQRSLWGNAWFQFRKHRLAMIGLVIFVFMVLATFVGSAIYPQEIDEIDFSAASGALSWAHPMGTDSMGQDQLARILWGGRISLSVGIFAALFAIIVGTLVGALAGFFGGPTETLLMRITDMFISLPQLPLLLVISFLFKQQVYDYFEEHFGSGVLGIFVLIVFVIAILNWMSTTRLVHASVLSTKEKEFIEAARCIGASQASQINKHILPNIMSPIIVAATLGVGDAIITESALSFLGLGFPSDIPTWGSMLYVAKDRLEIAPMEAIFPGMMIFLTVLSVNFIGDGLRDALDPRRTL